MNEYTAANRDAWDAIADLRQEIWPSADFFARGGSLLPEHELTAAGDVRGLRLCHLQCGSGEETLSWANAGAEVTGVDISPRQIDMANRKAEAAGIAAEFLAADVSSRPRRLTPSLSTSSTPAAARSSGSRTSITGPSPSANCSDHPVD